MSNTCNICCEKYNKSLNSKITCEISDDLKHVKHV